MAANLVWYAADGVTLLSELQWGAVPPGQDYFTLNGGYMECVLKNDGDLSTTVTVSISGADATVRSYLRVAQGDPSPGAFVDEAGSLALGAMVPAATRRLWVDVIVPAGAPLADSTGAGLVANGT